MPVTGTRSLPYYPCFRSIPYVCIPAEWVRVNNGADSITALVETVCSETVKSNEEKYRKGVNRVLVIFLILQLQLPLPLRLQLHVHVSQMCIVCTYHHFRNFISVFLYNSNNNRTRTIQRFQLVLLENRPGTSENMFFLFFNLLFRFSFYSNAMYEKFLWIKEFPLLLWLLWISGYFLSVIFHWL